jgi:hypothetical protein
VTKWVSGRHGPTVPNGRVGPIGDWGWGTVLRRLLLLLGATLLLVALSLAGSGSVVLAAADPTATSSIPAPSVPETLLYARLGIVIVVLGSLAGRRRRRGS